MKIYISPSNQEHNAYVCGGTEELWMNKVADVVVRDLKAKGHTVYRNKPTMTLAEIIKDSNSINPNIHVAIHSNAGSGKARGCEVYAYKIRDYMTNSELLANDIYNQLAPLTPTTDRGVKDGRALKLGEIINIKATSCLIEIAFHDNKDDAKWITGNIEKIGKAIVAGIINYSRR